MILGIDTGYAGAVAMISDEDCSSYAIPLCKDSDGSKDYDYKVLLDLFKSVKDAVELVFIERTFPTPFLHGKASWSLGYGFGSLRSIARAVFGFDKVKTVSVGEWQKAVFTGYKRETRLYRGDSKPRRERTKDLAVRVIKDVFPDKDWMSESRGKISIHDGKVDAYLIAEYGRRKSSGMLI